MMANRNRGNGHLPTEVGLNQLGPKGGAYKSGGGDQRLILNSSRVASKPHSLTRRVNSSGRNRKPVKISLAKVEF